MKSTNNSCHTKPTISEEQFIAEHFFSHLVHGSMKVYNGYRTYKISAGDFCLAQRNHLAKYVKERVNGQFRTVTMFFPQALLKEFAKEFNCSSKEKKTADAVIKLERSKALQNFIDSLIPYTNETGLINDFPLEAKRKELLLLLLEQAPALINNLFDFGDPGKINLEAFMNRNFRFNVSLQRFAYLTGRSLSAFKRDFARVFNNTPSRWLLQKRLNEARFLLENHNRKSSEIYVDLGFEDLSHFSFAFKKAFGFSPSELNNPRKTAGE